MSISGRNFGRMARVRPSRDKGEETPRSSKASQDLLSALPDEEFTVDDLEEFREFMAEAKTDELADPAFKERLRRDLWWMMVSRLSSKDEMPDS